MRIVIVALRKKHAKLKFHLVLRHVVRHSFRSNHNHKGQHPTNNKMRHADDNAVGGDHDNLKHGVRDVGADSCNDECDDGGRDADDEEEG